MNCTDKSPLTGSYIFYGLELYIAFYFYEQDKDNSMKLFLNLKLYTLFQEKAASTATLFPDSGKYICFTEKVKALSRSKHLSHQVELSGSGYYRQVNKSFLRVTSSPLWRTFLVSVKPHCA